MKTIPRRRIAPLLFLLLSAPTNALLPYSPVLWWTAPTQFVNGDPLDPATDLREYQLVCNGTLWAVTGPLEPWYVSVRNEFPAGSNDCHVVAVATDGTSSVASNVVNFTAAQDETREPGLRVTP